MQMMNNKFIWTIAVSLLASPLFAQDTLQLDLNKAIQLSVSNNKQLKADRAKIDQAAAQLKQAKEARLPDVKVSGSYLQLNHPNITLKTKDGSGAGTETPNPSSAVYGMATATLPIYSASKIKYGVEAAHFLEEAARLDAEKDKGSVILNTINAYTNLYKAYTAVKVVEDNLHQSQQRDKDFSNLEKNGLLARNDLLKAQLQTSNVELALVNAKNNLKLCTIGLNLMLGLPQSSVLTIDTSSLQIRPQVESLERYEQLAVDNRKDIKATGMRQDAAHSKTKQTRSDYFPAVGLTGGYIAADIPGLLTVTNALNVGVGIQYNLGNLWKNKSRMEEAKAVEREVGANCELLEQNIRMEVAESYENYFCALKKMDVQQKALENAKENNRITKNKYDNNLVNTTELLDAENALLEAQINVATAKADIVSAYYTLLDKAGTINTQTVK
jgi:outer membrane protein TolC